MQIVTKIMLVIAAIIHLLPVPGVLGASYLDRLYGLSFGEPNLLILMRHRAVLFGLLGLFLLYSVFRSELIPVAIVGGLLSAASFVAIAWSVGGANAQVSRVVTVDLVAVGCLMVAAVVHFIGRQQT